MERRGVGDQVVGGEGRHHRAGAALLDHRGGERDRRTRVAGERLDEDVALRQVGQLADDRGACAVPVTTSRRSGGAQRREPVEGGLQQRPVGAGQRVQELRVGGAGQRPQPGAAATGGHHHVQVGRPHSADDIRGSVWRHEGTFAERAFTPDFPLDMAGVLAPLRRGHADPAFRRTADGVTWLAANTADGPGTLALRGRAARCGRRPGGRARACCSTACRRCSARDDDDSDFRAHHPLVADLRRGCRRCGSGRRAGCGTAGARRSWSRR